MFLSFFQLSTLITMFISYFPLPNSSAIDTNQDFTSYADFRVYSFNLYLSGKAYGFTDYGIEGSWFPPNPDLEISQESILKDLNTFLSRVWNYYH